MDGLMCLMLWIKTQQVTADIVTRAKGSSWSPEMLEVALSDVKRHGLNTSLQAGVLSVFLLSVVIAAIALLISTFSSSTLFTIIMTLLVYVIGLIAGGVTEYWESDADGNTALVLLGKAIGLVLPNFKLFNLFDGAINGHFISGTIVLKLTITAFIYTLIYTILSWFVFQDKEF